MCCTIRAEAPSPQYFQRHNTTVAISRPLEFGKRFDDSVQTIEVESSVPIPRSTKPSQRRNDRNSPRGDVDIPVLRQVAEGLEVGQGRLDGDVDRGRVGRGGGGADGTGLLLGHR